MVDDIEKSELYTAEQILNTWERFFESKNRKDPETDEETKGEPYITKILELADLYPDERSIYVDYWDIDFFDAHFADYLLSKPTNALYLGEQAIIDLLPSDSIDKGVKLKLRIINLPSETQKIEISKLRTEHLGKFIAVEGLVKKALEVRPFLSKARFQCVRCYVISTVDQETTTYREPQECSKEQGGCGRTAASTSFKLLTEKSLFFDFQKIEIQERPEHLAVGRNPERIEIHADRDIAGRITPGDRIIINGTLRSTQKLTKFKMKSNLFDIYIECNSIQTEQKTYEDINLTKEETEEIKKTAKDPEIYTKIRDSIAPSIYGLELVKESIALQLFGGIRKDELPDGTNKRGEIHIFLPGDPGIAKTGLLDYVAKLSPRGIYASGKTSSAAGLTATAVRDEFSEGRWILEAGALVLANGGLCAIDEFDKMNEQDRSAIHEGMEQGRITINKAGMNVSLPSDCAILAAGNPKYGRFDEYRPISDQIDITPALLSRFDMIWPIRDIPNKEQDLCTGAHILKTHLAGELQKHMKTAESPEHTQEECEEALKPIEPPFSVEFMRKYISYAKNNIAPVMTEKVLQGLLDFYVTLRNQGSAGEVGVVSSTPRQLEALIRLAESSAKERLSQKVTEEDMERAIKLTAAYLKKVAMDSGILDIDIITTGISHTQRTRIIWLMDVIQMFAQNDKSGTADEDDLLAEAEAKGYDRDMIKQDLEKLLHDGRIFKPRDKGYKSVR